jgi:hypothetical protein
MATNINLNLTVGLMVGFFGGLLLFFRGFRTYREYLRVQGTPKIPIRSISMGLVRIHGKPTSERLVNSPVSHTPCCFYKLDIEKWKDEGESGTWLHYGSEADGVQFYLKDSSGRVLVDARGAEFDIESNVVREVASAKPSSTAAASGASDAELLDFVVRAGPSAAVPRTRHFLEGERAQLAVLKYIKHPTTPDELFQAMVGRQVAQIQQRLEAEGPQSDPLGEEIRLAQIELYTHSFWSPEYTEGFKRVTRLQEQLRKERSRMGAPSPLEPRLRRSDTGPRYRLTECCILPDHEYDVIGTCGENPEARDVNDRKLIRKGSNEPTYLISGLAGPDLNITLQMMAQLKIFGGAMLAVFCLGLLLLQFGLF